MYNIKLGIRVYEQNGLKFTWIVCTIKLKAVRSTIPLLVIRLNQLTSTQGITLYLSEYSDGAAVKYDIIYLIFYLQQ